MSELMEDATDFTWQGAKAAHAVLLCEIERGTVTWEDTHRIDRIRRIRNIRMGVQNYGERLIKSKNHGFANSFRMVPASKLRIMKWVAKSIDIFVHTVCHRVEY